MAKQGLLRMLTAALLQGVSLHIIHLGCGGGAAGPSLTQALSVDENAVPPHLQLPRLTHMYTHEPEDDEFEFEDVDGVVAPELLEQDDIIDDVIGIRELEEFTLGDEAGSTWMQQLRGSSSRRLLMRCKNKTCLPSCPRCRIYKGKRSGFCKRKGKRAACLRKKRKIVGGRKTPKKGGRKQTKKGGRKKPKKGGGRKKTKKGGRKKPKKGGGRKKTKKGGRKKPKKGGGRKKTKKGGSRKNQNDDDEGNEGNEGNEGDEGDEGDEGNEGSNGKFNNDNNEGNEGDEGDEGDEGNYGRRL